MNWKQRAVEQWTADPCGPEASGIKGLMLARRLYAPWMAERLAYQEALGLEVLDVGCGQGIDMCEFALAGARVTGVDLTRRHIELAKEHAREAGIKVTLVEGDAEKLPFPDRSFDRVVSNGVLHHTPAIEIALQEIRRVLRPDGKLTVILYNRNSWRYWLEYVLWRGLLHGRIISEGMTGILSSSVEKTSIGARPLVRVYSRRQVKVLLRRAGFKQVETWVSPFRPADSRFTRSFPELPLGHGWFVVAQGMKPTLAAVGPMLKLS